MVPLLHVFSASCSTYMGHGPAAGANIRLALSCDISSRVKTEKIIEKKSNMGLALDTQCCFLCNLCALFLSPPAFKTHTLFLLVGNQLYGKSIY